MAYVLVQLGVILLHECSHAVAGLVVGLRAVQFPFGVDFGDTTPPLVEFVATSAGPMFSLVTGLIAMQFRLFAGSRFWRMAGIWFAFLSAEEGFGYFTIAGFGSAGDTAVALNLVTHPAAFFRVPV